MTLPLPKRTSWIVVGGVLVLLVWAFAGYNSLVRVKEAVDAQWAQVETQYQRRADLVPNLVETVQGAAQFEQSTLREITEARTRWLNARTQPRDEQIAAAGGLDSAIARLLVTVENYPQLQAVQAFRDLQAQLEGTENRVAVARRDYNEAVRSYNVAVKTFPRAITARLFGFASEKFFEAAPGTEQVPRVNFLDAPTASPGLP